MQNDFCNNIIRKTYVDSDRKDGTRVKEDLPKRELLALKEIYLTAETSDKELARKFIDSDIIADFKVGSFILTHKGRSLLVRGSSAPWD